MKLSLVILALVLSFNVAPSTAADSGGQPKSRTKALAYSTVPAVVLIGGGIAAASIGNDDDGSDLASWAGFWMITGGMIVGPSLGHVYAERPKPLSGAAIRTGIGLMWGAGMVLAVGDSFDDNADDGTAIALITIASAGWLVSAGWDIATAGRSADTYNQRISSFSMELTPVYLGDHDAPGLALRISF